MPSAGPGLQGSRVPRPSSQAARSRPCRCTLRPLLGPLRGNRLPAQVRSLEALNVAFQKFLKLPRPAQHSRVTLFPRSLHPRYSCSTGGDSVALMAMLKQLNMYDAAKLICDEYQPAAAGQVARNAYTWKAQRVKALRGTIRQADEYTGEYTVETADQAWGDPIFRAAIQAKAQANCEIDELYAADKQELELLMVRGCSA